MDRWLVDGMNVIGSRPDGWWRDRGAAMRALAAELRAYAEARGEEMTVVFDGRPVSIPGEPGDSLTVAFAERGGRGAADDEIARRVGADGDASTLRVVTSDRQLAARVRARGASVMGAGSFRRRLERTAG